LSLRAKRSNIAASRELSYIVGAKTLIIIYITVDSLFKDRYVEVDQEANSLICQSEI